MLDQTCKCHICGRPYKVFSMMAGDQSACPKCVAYAEKRISSPDMPTEERRRRDYWGEP